MNYLGTEVKGYLSALLVLLLFLSEIPVCGAEDSGKVDEYRSLVINDSPLAYWPLDDSMSGGSADVMGNAPDITSGEDLEFVEMQPNLGGAIKLDGEKQYLKVNPNIPRLPDTFSIELWIQFDEMAGEDERGILFVPSTNDRKGLFVADEDSEDFSFGATKKGHVAFSYWGDFSYSVSDPDPIVAGELYHYVVTYGDEVLSLYRNGTLVNSIEEFESIYIYSDSYFIGGHPSSNNNDVQVEEVINGLVSDIAIYDYALSGDKVEQHYKSGVGISDSDYLVITNDTIILESDTRFENKHIHVDGASLTLDGSHKFSSMTLSSGAVLKHSVGASIDLEVEGVLEIDSSSKIDVSELGNLSDPQNCEACGGAHASYGGGRGQIPYGSYKQPLELGAGGKHSVNGVAGARGGGSLHLKAKKLMLNGNILANGGAITSSYEGGYSGGGAGGSIFLQVDEIEGDGSISAHGGAGNNSYANGGSGGRIAVYYKPGSVFNFIKQISAKGGKGKLYGGPGSVFLHDGAVEKLNVKNANAEFGSLKYWDVEEGDAQVHSVSPSPSSTDLGGSYYIYGGSKTEESRISQEVSLIGGNISQAEIDEGKIALSVSWIQSSYSGDDEGQIILEYLDAYGNKISESTSELTTTEAQEWEQRNLVSTVPVGTTSFNLVIRSVRRSGVDADSYYDNIRITAHRIDYDPVGGEDFSGLLILDNQASDSKAEPYVLENTAREDILLRNAALQIPEGVDLRTHSIRGNKNALVTFSGSFSYEAEDFIVDGYTLVMSSSYDFDSLFAVVNRGGVTIPSAEEDTFLLQISANDIYIADNSSVDVSAKGKKPIEGSHFKSGGSYGGVGGADPVSGTVAETFGSIEMPTDFGVGGYGSDVSMSGTRGGGAIKLIANNKFEVYGDILANGEDGLSQVGAGSGGSIWIEAKELIGNSNTLIEASGGRGYFAASGGGGRVAIYYDSLTGFDPAARVFARAGNNYSGTTAYGGPGTVYLYDRSAEFNNAKLQIANHNASTSYAPYTFSGQVDAPIFISNARAIIEEGTYLNSSISGAGYSSAYVSAKGDFTVANNNLVVDGYTLELPQDYSFDSISVKNNGKITTPAASGTFTSGITLTANDFYISSNSYIDVSSKGRLPEEGEHWKSGGSYGGLGGADPTPGTVAPIFGSMEAPVDFGVGGYGIDASVQGSRGGGAIKLVATNKFEVYGDILANGGFQREVGGGSGGSIWIEAKELIGGNGTLIEASGGRGYLAATGGGGRIAIYYDSLTGFNPENSVFARAGYNYSWATGYGSQGTVYLYDRSLPSNNARLQFINRGTSTAYAPYHLSGEVDIPIYFEDLRVILEEGVTLSAPLTFKETSVIVSENINLSVPITFINSEVVLKEGVHLGSTISGNGYNSVYIKAEGDFTTADNNLVVDGYTLELPQDYSFDSITIKNSGKITTPEASDTFTSDITLTANNFYISSNSYIDVSDKGRLPEEGEHWKSGGSYGGLGGADPTPGTVAPTFGSMEAPVDFGVGGYGIDASVQGSRGGGAIKLVATNKFEVYGDILANGGFQREVGGGSGGSIWIEAKELIGGNGTLIEASGGRGYLAATGGGGRIAIYYDSLTGFNPENSVFARAGYNYSWATGYGSQGTVYLYDRSLPSNNAKLQIINRGTSTAYEPYQLSGQVDIPIYFEDLRIIIDESVNLSTPLSFKDAVVTLKDGVHLGSAISGNGYGSVYVKAEGDFTVANNNLVVDGYTLELPQDYSFDSITVKNSGKITTPAASGTFTSGITLTANDFYISSNSYIDVSSKGRLPEEGEHWKSGGSYGGLGGVDPTTGTVASTFGSVEAPVDFGMGGYGADATVQGSRGGGAIKLIASNKFEVYGDILANGEYLRDVGAGSGGSIWIEAKELIGGSGTWIEASGGRGYLAGTGGGGRIAIYYDSLTGFNPVDCIFARAGYNYSNATAYGGPGTVYLYDRSLPSNNAKLQIINRGTSTAYEPYQLSGQVDIPIYFEDLRIIIDESVNLSTPLSFKDAVVTLKDGVHLGSAISGNGYGSVYVKSEGDFTVANNNLVVDGYTLELPQDYSFDSITVKNSGKITTPAASGTFTSGITLTANDFYISSNSYIDVSSKGRLPEEGEHWKSGGSYGGLGGVDPTTGTVASTFGSVEAPVDFGMGGYGADATVQGSRGGGAIKLIASNKFEVYGDILANGEYLRDVGAGSGGSIWVEAKELIGSSGTLIEASGGRGYYAGTGGGGRIAIYYDSLTGFDPAARVFALAGNNYAGATAYGGPGTVYLYDRSLPSNNAKLQIINRGTSTAYEPYRLSGEVGIPVYFSSVQAVIEKGAYLAAPISGSSYSKAYVKAEGDFTVANNNLVVDGYTLELPQDYSFDSITVKNSGKITTPAASDIFTSGITLSATDFYISSNSYIDVSGKGYLPSEEVSYQSGGSYGGLGGVLADGTTNAVYGSAVAPMDFGTGGRYQDDSQPGSRGGGAIKLVADRLEHYGYIDANGYGSSSYKGGGSGGSIWLDIGELVVGGNGYIRANGGYGINAGAGGGGRVAIYYESLTGLNTSRVEANDGGSNSSGVDGEDGSVHIAEKTAAPRVRAVSPSGYHNAPISSVVVQFNIGIDNESLDINDFELTDSVGNFIAITSVTSLDDIRYQIDFAQPLGEGVYTFSVGPDIFGTNGLGMDQDQDGVEQEPEDDRFSVPIVVDITKPAPLTLDQPLAPEINNSNSRWITLSGNREDDTAILVNGSEIVPSGSGRWSGRYYLPEGESTIEVVARDLSGNLSEPVFLIFNVDSNAPNITAADPIGSLNLAPPYITLVVIEEGSGIDLQNSDITVKRNGVVLAGALALFEGQIQFTPDAPFLDGDYEIVAQVADKLGNLSAKRTYHFTLDYTPPAPATLNDYPPVTTVNAHVFSGTKEAGSAVLVNGSLAVVASADTTWSTQVALSSGDNTIAFVVRDAAGNESEPTLAQIRYDNNPPGPVALVIDPNGSGSDLLLNWSSYDEFANGNDIGEYRIYQSASSFTDIAGKTPVAVVPQGTKQFRVEGLPRDTQAHFAVVAYDTQGLFNPAVTSTGAVPVDVAAPDEISNLIVIPGTDRLQLSWNPSANSAGDLAGYKVVFAGDLSGRVDDIPLASLSDSQAPVEHLVEDLSPATSYPLRVYAYDESGNASVGIEDAGTTLLPNPTTVTAVPKSSKIEISWSSVAPYELLKNYAVYVEDKSFNSIVGLQLKAVRSKGAADSEHSWSLAGLKNGTTYYVAVTAVNISGGSDPVVTPVAVTPVEDTDGPVIHAAQYQQIAELLDLTLAPTLSEDGSFKITAEDESGVSRIEFYLDGTLLGTAYTASSGAFGRNIVLLDLSDGEHVLTVKAYDVWENVTIAQYSFTVALAPPPAPQITSPSDGWVTNKPSVIVYGKAEKQTQVQVYRNGVAEGSVAAVDSYGNFQVEISLEEGENQISAAAAYPQRSGFGEPSATRTIVLNTSIPDAPTNLTAIERELGQISLSWNAANSDDIDNQTAGYNVYRLASPFTSVQEAQQLNNQLLNETKFTDLPSVDGNYFYAVTTVNKVGTESSLSNLVEATADSEGPHALEVRYHSNGLVDSASGHYAPGTVEVVVQFDEPLRNKPYFAIVPEGGVPIAVDLSKDYSDDTLYTGSFIIEPDSISGTAYAVMSAHDNVGNRGTVIEQGATLLIDAQGPEVTALTLNPGEPLKVDEVSGLQVEVVLQLSDEVKQGEMPTLVPLLDNLEVPGYESGITLVRDVQSIEGSPLWVGSFTLPASAGRDADGNPTVANLSFSYQALDDLDNIGNKIRVPNSFQVYQGDLPPLDIPQNLKATALPGGKVALTWDAVEGARYVLYRKAEGDAEFVEILRLSETETQDVLPDDGNYFYAIASERRNNNQVAVSAMSEPVAVSADSIPPAAPSELALELNGAGIVATWQAPLQDADGNDEAVDKLTYNLYRLNLAEGETATAETLREIEPLQIGIPDTIALDAKPSESEHVYVVTALDEAGNESVPSNTVYLNFGLLPVSDLSISVSAEGNPQLQWNHSGTAIAGYRVYVGESDDLQEITDALIPHGGNTTVFVDTGYSAGAQGVMTERRYTVIAEDEKGATSIGHNLLLPALSVEVIEPESGDAVVKRGVMNEVRFRVQNRGSSDISGIKLFATVNDGGVAREHQSASFSVAAGGLVEVPIVIGGYEKLDTLSNIQLRLEQSPLPGETVFIHAEDEILVGDAALRLGLETDTVYRGGLGKVRFTMENTSLVETEVLMARRNGRDPSDEVRIRIEDADGNLLASQPVQQFTGDVITVASGETVARLQPGETFVSDWIEVPIPQAAPDQVTVALEIDRFRYHTGKPTQVLIEGNGTRIQASLQETAYYGEVTEVTPGLIYSDGEVVTISGRAMDRTSDSPVGNVPLTLVMELRGFERQVSVITDADGNFSYEFDPQGQSGTWRISVIHPDSLARPNQGEFAVLTSEVSPPQITLHIPRNYTQVIPININAGYGSELTDVRLVSVAEPGTEQLQIPQGLHLDLGSVIALSPQQKGVINLSFSGDNLAPESGSLYFQVLANVNGVAQVLEDIALEYRLSESQPVIKATPAFIDTGVALGGSTTETFTLKNTGFDVLRNATLSLVDSAQNPAPTWVRLDGTANLGDMDIGASRDISVTFSPDNTVEQGNYEFRLLVEGDGGHSFTVQMFVAVVTSEIGDVFFHISDIYTATLGEDNQLIPGLAGAKIELQNEQVLSETRTISSDANGEALLKDLPAGRYAYRVSAFDHESVSGRLWIRPGATVAEEVFLMNRIVTVEWQVNEINLEDRYEIKLEATFETNVPVAVVMLDPISVTLPDMKKGDVFTGELSLTNYGLIRADEVQGLLPSGNDVVSFEFLAEVPETLEAGEVVYIPYRITALRDFNPSEEGAASGAGCGSHSFKYKVSYQSQCANGQVVPGGTSTYWSTASYGSCGGAGGGSGGGYYFGGGGGSGASYGSGYTPISKDETLRCEPDPSCDECNKYNTAAQ